MQGEGAQVPAVPYCDWAEMKNFVVENEASILLYLKIVKYKTWRQGKTYCPWGKEGPNISSVGLTIFLAGPRP